MALFYNGKVLCLTDNIFMFFLTLRHVDSNISRHFSSMTFLPQMHNTEVINFINNIKHGFLVYSIQYIMTADLVVTVKP